MSCDRYEREGLLARERGEPNPHLEGCADCQAAAAAYDRLTAAMGDAGARYRPREGWQARVLAGLAAGPAPAPRRWWPWLLGPALAAAAILLFVLLRGGDPARPALAVRHEVRHGAVAMRGGDAAIGDTLEAHADGADALWIYRDDRVLVVACPRGAGCTPARGGWTTTLVLDTPGRWQIVGVRGANVTPTGDLDRDLAAVITAGGARSLDEFDVR